GAYLAALRDEYGASVFDATTWCDDDDFADGHHLLREPAERFSERFGRDVMRPFVAAAGHAPAAVARRERSHTNPRRKLGGPSRPTNEEGSFLRKKHARCAATSVQKTKRQRSEKKRLPNTP
ncbi:MAG TPA: hypothetical protein VMV69_17450, partial [Pirellulales bacterium]|nr:hypothetical protein [Pirellulales bacterium]